MERIYRRCLFGLLLVLIIFYGNATYGDFYVVPTKNSLIGTCIKSIPYVITEEGFYYLEESLSTSDTSNNAIEINADNVTLDLMGNTISGPGHDTSGNSGIKINDDFCVIRNGNISDFGDYGILDDRALSSDPLIHITNVVVEGNGNGGIYLNTKHNNINDCKAYYNRGFGIKSGINSKINECRSIDNSGDGISTFEDSDITNCISYNNGGYGIYVKQGSLIINNQSIDNTNSGISVDGSGCLIKNNLARDNGGHGIYCSAANTIIGNNSNSNDKCGINAGADNLITNNCCTNNNQSGGAYTNLEYTTGSTVDHNVPSPP